MYMYVDKYTFENCKKNQVMIVIQREIKHAYSLHIIIHHIWCAQYQYISPPAICSQTVPSYSCTFKITHITISLIDCFVQSNAAYDIFCSNNSNIYGMHMIIIGYSLATILTSEIWCKILLTLPIYRALFWSLASFIAALMNQHTHTLRQVSVSCFARLWWCEATLCVLYWRNLW